jgi:adenosylcobyric acid synthase
VAPFKPQNMTLNSAVTVDGGDISLLQPGLDWLEQRTGKPLLGVLPDLHGLMLDAEDAIAPVAVDPEKQAKIKIVAPVVPRISNHNDLAPPAPAPRSRLPLGRAGRDHAGG